MAAGVGTVSYTPHVPDNKKNKRGNSGGQKAAPAKTAPAARPLAWHQFQELNYSFYQEQPSDFINMRVELLSLMLCNEEELAPAYAVERSINGVQLGGTTPPSARETQAIHADGGSN